MHWLSWAWISGRMWGDDIWDYIDRAGGLTYGVALALVKSPNGNTERHGLESHSSDPVVPDGSIIRITKMPTPPPEGNEVD